MRSGTSAALAIPAALLLAACGDYSTEDLRFIAALPTRQDLRVEVPAQAAAQVQAAVALVAPGDGTGVDAAAACGVGAASAWLWAKPTSDNLNASVEFLTGLVDTVRRVPPTWRQADARGWGPWPDRQHPGRELQVVLQRSFPDGVEAAPLFHYEFQARLVGAATWIVVLDGDFRGGSATRGAGHLAVHFDRIAQLGPPDPGSPVAGTMAAQYDRATTPVTVAVTLDQDGFGLPGFGYQYAGYPDRSGSFVYLVRNAAGDQFVIDAAFDGAGRGRSTVAFRAVGGFTASYQQCWDADACVLWVNDPWNITKLCAAAPCTVGSEASCAATP